MSTERKIVLASIAAVLVAIVVAVILTSGGEKVDHDPSVMVYDRCHLADDVDVHYTGEEGFTDGTGWSKRFYEIRSGRYAQAEVRIDPNGDGQFVECIRR